MRLNKVSMKANEEPDILFQQLAEIQDQHNNSNAPVEEMDLIAVAYNVAPERYQSVLAMLQMNKQDLLTLDDVEKAMKQVWQQNKVSKGKGKDNDQELALVTAGANRKGPKCFNCNEIGHISRNCPNKRSKNSNALKKCRHCGKPGHEEKSCWNKPGNDKPNWLKEKEAKRNEMGAAGIQEQVKQLEIVLCTLTFPKTMTLLEDPDVWIADSAATVDSTPCSHGIKNITQPEESEAITMGNGDAEGPSMIGNISGTICDQFGNERQQVCIKRVRVLPNGKYNLFSITKRIANGWTLGGDKDSMWLSKGNEKVVFDIKIPTKEGMVYALYFRRNEALDHEVTAMSAKSEKIIPTSKAHGLLGHSNEYETRKTAKALGWNLSRGEFGVCIGCMEAKAKQKNITTNVDAMKAERPNKLVHLDIATLKVPQSVQAKIPMPVWRIIVDSYTNYKTSHFYASKDAMVTHTCQTMKAWKDQGIAVKVCRMDNAGENKVLEKEANGKDWQLGIEFQYTARATPQQNSLAEVGFATIMIKARAMMASANIPIATRYRMINEVLKTATLLDGLVVKTIKERTATRCEHEHGQLPKWTQHMRTFGEAGTVKVHTKMAGKVNDRGIQCIFVGYALQHSPDTYRMWNPKTNSVLVSRDIIWLRRMYYPKLLHGVDKPIQVIMEDDVGDDSEEMSTKIIIPVAQEQQNPPQAEPEEVQAKPNPRLERVQTRSMTQNDKQMQTRSMSRKVNLAGLLTEAERAYYGEIMGKETELALIGAATGSGIKNTNELHVLTYEKAMASGEKREWQKSIEEEHNRMKDNKVFQVVDKAQVLKEGRKIITSTWAMKKKANGIYRARMVARGFEQVDGEHYDSQTKGSPVVSQMTVMIVLTLITMGRYVVKLKDVNGAFLLPDLKENERIYMEIPKGFERHYDPDKEVWLLLKTLYGLIQAAYAFWTLLVNAFKKIDYKRSCVDPCLFY